MKNVLTFKIGKEQIALWQLFIMAFIVFMFAICLFLGIGFITKGDSDNNVNVSVGKMDNVYIVTDFEKASQELYDLIDEKLNTTYKNKFDENYKNMISDNTGNLVFSNIDFDYYMYLDSIMYKIKFNKNKWFILNELNKDMNDSNIIYIVDSNMSYHRIQLQIENVVKDYTENEGYTKYEVGDFTFYVNGDRTYFYGYKYINDKYFVTINNRLDNVNKNAIKEILSEDTCKKFFKEIGKNISIEETTDSVSAGISLNKNYKNIKITKDFNLNLHDNVTINLISNGTNRGVNTLAFTYRNGISDIVVIREQLRSIDEVVSNKKIGYLPFIYNEKNIYIKYDLKNEANKEFTYSHGIFNGVLIGDENNSYVIEFSKDHAFESQEELVSELDTLLKEFLK